MAADLDRGLGGLRVEEIHSFVVLAEELHFARAAQRLFLSPGGLSRRVTHLERALGASLLHRTTRNVALTTHGEEFLPAAQEIMAQLGASRDWHEQYDASELATEQVQAS
jgi:DNA-binding transcriptional LysR family regulator